MYIDTPRTTISCVLGLPLRYFDFSPNTHRLVKVAVWWVARKKEIGPGGLYRLIIAVWEVRWSMLGLLKDKSCSETL